MSLQNVLATGLVLALSLPIGRASADPIGDMARAAEKQARASLPLRAEIRATIDGVDGKKEERIVLLVRSGPGKADDVQTYLEIGGGKMRYLVAGDGQAYRSEGGTVKKVPADTAIDGTSWTVEDLLPFSAERCGVMRNVDATADQMTVLCNPIKGKETGQYALTVYRFDREKAVPTRVMYYQERQDNLVKMLRNEDFTQVGSSWRPARMVMQNFPLRTRDTFEAKWTEASRAPADAFDPEKFANVELDEPAR